MLGLIAGVLLMPAFPGSGGSVDGARADCRGVQSLFGEGLESALTPALWLSGGALLGAVAGFIWSRRRASRTSQ